MLRRTSLSRTLFGPLIVAIVLAMAVRSVVRVYSIPSRSMQPALQVGDHIAVMPYWRNAHPERGDVVVFRSPADPSEFLVKRVIAVPGELIASRSGLVTIGGRPLTEPYLSAPASTASIEPQLVPQNCLFVMGDNRTTSLDSRSWGVLPFDRIVGRARLVLWSSHGDSASPAAFASSRESWPHDLLRRDRVRLLLPIN